MPDTLVEGLPIDSLSDVAVSPGGRFVRQIVERSEVLSRQIQAKLVITEDLLDRSHATQGLKPKIELIEQQLVEIVKLINAVIECLRGQLY